MSWGFFVSAEAGNPLRQKSNLLGVRLPLGFSDIFPLLVRFLLRRLHHGGRVDIWLGLRCQPLKANNNLTMYWMCTLKSAEFTFALEKIDPHPYFSWVKRESPTPGPQTGTVLWPARNWTTQLEMSGGHMSKVSSVLTAPPHHWLYHPSSTSCQISSSIRVS